MRLTIAVILALGTVACGSSSKNTLDDIAELAGSLTGQPTTIAERLERILRSHDRRNAASWPLLANVDGNESFRVVIRDIEKLEGEDYPDLTSMARTIYVLLQVAEHSAADLVRSRALLATVRIAGPIPLGTPDLTRRPTDSAGARMLELFRAADEAVVTPDRPESPERMKARRGALVELASFRFWPPERFRLPSAGRKDSFEASRRWSFGIYGYVYRNAKFLPDLRDPTFGPKIDRLLAGLLAEVLRFESVRALRSDRADEVRFDAVASVTHLESGDLVPALASAARDEGSPRVRQRIAKGLAEIGATNLEAAVPALYRLLDDDEEDVRHTAHEGLQAWTGQSHGEDREAWADWWASRDRGTEENR